jgi:hypothetical protein
LKGSLSATVSGNLFSSKQARVVPDRGSPVMTTSLAGHPRLPVPGTDKYRKASLPGWVRA